MKCKNMSNKLHIYLMMWWYTVMKHSVYDWYRSPSVRIVSWMVACVIQQCLLFFIYHMCIRLQTHLNLHWICFHSRWTVNHPGSRFNIRILSYQYRKSHCWDKTVVRSSYLYNGISSTGKITSLYWIRVLTVVLPWPSHLFQFDLISVHSRGFRIGCWFVLMYYRLILILQLDT